jgi:hypothetical protein
MKTLLAKLFVEAGCRDIDDFKALERCLGQEHRGQQVHACFMRTFCHKIQKPQFEIHPPKQPSPERPIEQSIPIVVEPQAGPSTTNEGAKPSNPPSDKENKEGARSKAEKRNRAEKFADRNSKKPQRGEVNGNRSPRPNKTSKASEKKPVGKFITKLSGANNKIVLFVSTSFPCNAS